MINKFWTDQKNIIFKFKYHCLLWSKNQGDDNKTLPKDVNGDRITIDSQNYFIFVKIFICALIITNANNNNNIFYNL